MKPPQFAFLLALLFAFDSQAANLGQLLSNTLILGASVSAGKVTPGPGTRLAKRHGGRAVIRAESGQPGSEYEEFEDGYFNNFTSVIAIDFLYWDSAITNTFGMGSSYKAFDSLVDGAAARGIPLVVGNVPNLVGFWKQFNRNPLNQHIASKCRESANCFILDFITLHNQATSQGIVINGKRYMYNELTDEEGIHLNAIGSEYVAGMIANLLQRAQFNPKRVPPGARTEKETEEEKEEEDD